MPMIAHDLAVDQRRLLSEALWRLLLSMYEHSLPFPLAINPDAPAHREPGLHVQVAAEHFRDWLDRVDSSVVSSEEHEGAMHMHVSGRIDGKLVHVVAVVGGEVE